MAKSVKFNVRSNLIVVGTGLSGLVTGAVLARAGKKVIVLSDGAGSNDHVTDPPFLSQMLLVGFERDSPVDRIFNELGISLSLMRRTQERFKKNPSYLQVVSTHFRHTLCHDRDELLDNLKAGFGEKTHLIKSLLDQLDHWGPVIYPFLYSPDFPDLRKETWFGQLSSWIIYRAKVFKLRTQKAADFCEAAGLDEEGLDYFNALSIFLTGQTLKQLSTLRFFQLLTFLKNEPFVSVKGLSGLRELFLKMIKENKGEILSINPSSLHFQKNRITGMEFLEREGIGCDTLIWNPQKGGLQRERRTQVYQFYFFLDEAAVPSSMGDFLILKRRLEHPFDEHNFLFLSLTEKQPSESKEGSRSISNRGLLVQCRVDLDRHGEDENRLVKEIEERLIWLMPFAENRLKFSGIKIVNSDIQIPSYFPEEAVRRVAVSQKSDYPNVTLGQSFYFFPHPSTDFVMSPFLIKRGYDMANIIKTENKF